MAANLVLPQYSGMLIYDDLLSELRQIGCVLIVDFVRINSGMRVKILDGFWIRTQGLSWRHLDAAQLTEVRRHWRGRYDHALHPSIDFVVDLLRDRLAEDRLGLRRLILFQFRQVATGTAVQLKRWLTDLGIDEDEVEDLAQALANTRCGPSADAVMEIVRMRRSGDLDRAAPLARAMAPVVTDHVLAEFLDRVSEDQAAVAGLRAQAAAAESGGRGEDAAAAYLSALAILPEDESLRRGLSRCPPPMPVDVGVTVAGHSVRVRWREVAAAGIVTYRIRRGSDGELRQIAEVSSVTFNDHTPPLGPDLVYEVSTVRNGLTESRGAAGAPVRVTPEVGGLRLLDTRQGVMGTWAEPAAAASVRVIRTGGDGSDAGEREVPAREGAFHDDRPPLGRLRYRVSCAYALPSGERAWSRGVVGDVQVRPWPRPVADFEVVVCGEDVEVRWEPIGAGDVLVIDAEQPMAPGTDLSSAQVAVMGRTLVQQSADVRSPHRMVLADRGLHHLTALTVLDGRAVIGQTRTVDVLPGAANLTAERRDDTVHVMWRWPAGVSQMLVSWRSEDGENCRRVLLDRYRRGGCVLPVSEKAQRVEVAPLCNHPEHVTVGPVAWAEVPPRHDLAYEIVRRKNARWVSIKVYPPLPGAEFVLIARPGEIRPTRIQQGVALLRARLPERDEEYPLGRSDLAPPYYMLGFLTGTDASVRLIHPDRAQLLVVR
ncbi:fibronectin type III domain-containing protein [Nonomuraea sp. NPDC050404]|uniref:fibronectin type III domain-containing protein n=1 Tax=Nonomuraea sp. NPDC050404 TaxID=3155783 RepID=UPI0033C1D6ED